MKKILIMLMALLACNVFALNILVWDNDVFGYVQNPDIPNQSITIEQGITQALQSNNQQFEVVGTLPEDLSNYDIIFVTLGIFCSGWGLTPPGVVTPYSERKLLEFLALGKSIYIEGTNYAADHAGTDLFNRLGIGFAGDGGVYNVEDLRAENQTIVSDLNFEYLFQTDADYSVDELTAANGATVLFKSQDNIARTVAYEHPEVGYRAITSSVIIAALKDNGRSNKAELMYRYLNYLSANVSSNDEIANSINKPEVNALQNYPNPFNPSTTLSFSVNKQTAVKLKIYNAKGQIVKKYTKKVYKPGVHLVKFDGKDDDGNSLPSGIYFFNVKSARYTSTKKIVLMK